jgi:predicted metal-dependent hydrolase
MPSNEILEEIWKTRDEHARRFNYDLEAIFEDLRKQQEAGKRKVISFLEPMPNLS